ncbi:MAG: 50S ribosomal protein L15 [Syntrophales bacterium]|jgi:large subunit ribosomal protein L15|nr:50S ribosomal protein L15 [Syntrophales bacterium]MCU0553167.1 50S ribosomal protein L15 [Syntrophales bacterium]MCU0582237.1 50S ribosomal protein L15 [Syntrophales bacterium]
MNLSELRPPEGSRKKRKRIGRGDGSGHGGTSTKGHKGLKARSGHNSRPGYEGGQMPLSRRLPKKGFKNVFRKEIVIVNLGELNRFSGEAPVDAAALLAGGVIRRTGDGIKVLAKGTIEKALTVRVNAISQAAKEKIEAAGGKVEVIG